MSQTPQYLEGLDPHIATLLKSCVDEYYNEDRATREMQLRRWRKLKLYWNSMNLIYYSTTAKDYRAWGAEIGATDGSDQEYYDKPINVYRAFLETIIAALSIQIPAVVCVPEDADNPADLSTAKAGNIISEIIYKHNNVIFLWLYALYVHCTEGMVACYSYIDESEKYGIIKRKKYEDSEFEGYECPSCGEKFTEFDTYDLNSEEGFDLLGNNAQSFCPECGEDLPPEALNKKKLRISKFIGTENHPKKRVKLEIYGGMYIKVAAYATCQAETPYLMKMKEINYVDAIECYPDLRDKLPKGANATDTYEAQARLNPEFREEYPQNVITEKQTWLRPAAFNIHNKEDAELLKKEFPSGCCVTMYNDIIADYYKEDMDDSWTLSKNPLSDYLVHEPLGELLVNVQDIVNDLISLTLQTIEQGIAQTWADPSVVNFEQYRQLEAAPGTITPTKMTPEGGRVADAFFTSKQAALSPEVFSFYRIVQELGQFVSGALPSIFGGQLNASSSRTAAEYSMSRSGALQRLQTPWKMLTLMWEGVFSKAIPLYISTVEEDQKFVERDKQGNFVNTWVRVAELQGKIGDVELEDSDQLPVSEEQKRQIVMELLALNNAEIQTALASPENLPYLRKIVRLEQFRLPGEDDRKNEYDIITKLLDDEPQELMNLQTGTPERTTTIPVDPLLDNPQIGADILRGWLISEAGRLAKIENPLGYENVLLRLKNYIMLIQQQQQQLMMQQLATQMNMNGNGNGNKEKSNTVSEPPADDDSAETIEEENASGIQ